ncbi:MAG: hypothetical protein JEY94_12240 [Melioribacteraceae bacterium]|nr:hypothetical protein [Melioribacteraceae bacterium]
MKFQHSARRVLIHSATMTAIQNTNLFTNGFNYYYVWLLFAPMDKSIGNQVCPVVSFPKSIGLPGIGFKGNIKDRQSAVKF